MAALTRSNDRLQRYPDDDLDLGETPFSGFGGVALEQTQFVLMDPAFDRTAGGETPTTEATTATVAHEVAHLWWYGPVGHNRNRHALSGKGMAELSTAPFREHRSGPEAGETQRRDVRQGFEAFVTRAGNQVVDHVVGPPADAFFPSEASFPTGYRRGPPGLLGGRDEIRGDG